MQSTRMQSVVLALAALAALAAWLPSAVPGQESYQTVAFEKSTESSEAGGLRSETATLREQIQSQASTGFEGHDGCGCGGGLGGGGGCEAACDCCDCGDCCPCSRSQGWFASAELGFLRPHNSAGTGFNIRGLGASAIGVTTVGASLNFEVDPDFRESGRVTAGWQRCDGMGVRARYWEFDHAFDEGASIGAAATVTVPPVGVALTVGLPLTVGHSWDAYALDLEVFDTTKLGCHWDATWSVGFRYVEYEEVRSLALNVPLLALNVSQLKNFQGIGMTSAFELRSQLTSNIGVFANARGSMLMGDETDLINVSATVGTVTATVSVNEVQRNDVKFIFETQAGAEYILPICGGGYYFARAGVEMQYWDNFGVSPTGLLFDESSGFGGFFAAAGIQR